MGKSTNSPKQRFAVIWGFIGVWGHVLAIGAVGIRAAQGVCNGRAGISNNISSERFQPTRLEAVQTHRQLAQRPPSIIENVEDPSP